MVIGPMPKFRQFPICEQKLFCPVGVLVLSRRAPGSGAPDGSSSQVALSIAVLYR